jgi:hypothetical protein
MRIMLRIMIMVAAAVMAFMIMMMRHALFENGFDNFFQHRNRSFLNRLFIYYEIKPAWFHFHSK